MSAAAKYVFLGYTSARSSMAYAGEIVARTAFMAVILYVFTQLWTAIYSTSASGTLAGLTLQQMLWYLMITESIVLSSPRVSAEVDEDVRTGRLATHLLRPMSYALALLGKTMGERAVRFTINLAAGTVVAAACVGRVPLSLSGIGMFALLLPLAFVLDFAACLFIGLFAFWLESTAGLMAIYSRGVMLLGGMLIPIDLYPATLQRVVRWLPVSSMIYGPARMAVAPDPALMRRVIAVQAAGLVLCACGVAVVLRAGLKRVYSNGG